MAIKPIPASAAQPATPYSHKSPESLTSDQHPTPQIPKGLVPALAFAAFGIYLATLSPVIVTLAIRTADISPGSKTASLGLVISVGALVSLLAMPLAGALSDRTRGRFGRRRPWLVGGSLLGTFGLVVAGLASNIAVLAIGWVVAQIGFSGALAGFLALFPERLPETLRGKVSGLVGFVTAIAVLVGVFGASRLINHPLVMMAVPGAVAIAATCLLAKVVRQGEPTCQLVPEPLRAREIIGMFWINPRRHPDYGWTWLSRLLVGLAIAGLTTYASYFLTDRVGFSLDQATQKYALTTAITTPISLICFLVAGYLSDRSGRRKPFVLASSALVAIALGLACATTTIGMFTLVFIVLTLGQAFFLTVDIALAADVIPDPEQAAKGMAVYQVACNAPGSLIGLIGPILLAIGATSGSPGDSGSGTDNYPLLFGICAALALIGGLLVTRIRSVR